MNAHERAMLARVESVNTSFTEDDVAGLVLKRRFPYEKIGLMEQVCNGSVLVVDRGERWTSEVERMVRSAGFDVVVHPLRELIAGKGEAFACVPDAVVADLPSLEENPDWLGPLRERALHCVAVVLLPEVSQASLHRAARFGAVRVLSVTADAEVLHSVIEEALDLARLLREGIRVREARTGVPGAGRFALIGEHPAMRELASRIDQAARSSATVLIQGETGTGKELVASAVHERSPRRTGPFVRLNCAALAEGVLESELFGHEKGAFTGALSRRRGRLEQADGGTLFLDEVSEMPPPVQVKLLRFLQERELERVGGQETIRVDVRVVAATNRNLRHLLASGLLREDLYYRLKVIVLEVPSLRVRAADIGLLARHFLRRHSDENGKSVRDFTPRAMQTLTSHHWPGNVRELEHAVEHAVVLCDGDLVDVDDLPASVTHPALADGEVTIPGATLAEIERYAILRTLESVGWSPSRAAAKLGVSRRTIQYRLRDWGIARARPSSKPPPEPVQAGASRTLRAPNGAVDHSRPRG